MKTQMTSKNIIGFVLSEYKLCQVNNHCVRVNYIGSWKVIFRWAAVFATFLIYLYLHLVICEKYSLPE